MNFDLTINISRTELLEMICEKLKGQGFSDISHSNISFEVDDEYSCNWSESKKYSTEKGTN